MRHDGEKKCSAQDLILVTGGVACSCCGASSVPRFDESLACTATCSDGKPCPIPRNGDDGFCWAHRIIAAVPA